MSAGEKLFPCYICNSLFRHKRSMVRHLRGHGEYNKPDLPFECQFCPRKFYSEYILTKHSSIHDKKEKELPQCDICNTFFSNKKTLKEHLLTHTEEKPFQCEICLKNFRRKYTLTCHYRTHSEKQDFPCELCGKKFAMEKSLMLHLQDHDGEHNLTCHICGKSFSAKSSLVRHCGRHNNPHRPFKCEECGKSFRLKTILKDHMLNRHNEERPFVCEICNQAFKRKATVKTHMKRVHENKKSINTNKEEETKMAEKKKEIDETKKSKKISKKCIDEKKSKPFQCIWCGVCFSFKKDLINHECDEESEEEEPLLEVTVADVPDELKTYYCSEIEIKTEI